VKATSSLTTEGGIADRISGLGWFAMNAARHTGDGDVIRLSVIAPPASPARVDAGGKLARKP
jgi:hypothetical protein